MVPGGAGAPQVSPLEVAFAAGCVGKEQNPAGDVALPRFLQGGVHQCFRALHEKPALHLKKNTPTMTIGKVKALKSKKPNNKI